MSELDFFLTSPKLLALKEAFLKKETLLIEELWNSPKALIGALLSSAVNHHLLIVTGTSQEEMQLFHDIAFFSKNRVLEFPSWEMLPSENVPPSPDIVGERYEVLKEIVEAKEPLIILASLQSCLQKLLPPKLFSSLSMTIEKGKSYPFEATLANLSKMGYKRAPIASDKGEFAVRGGLIDLYPISSPDPFRIEFWGDEVESIRIYDPIGQKSVKTVDRIEIPPAQELELLSNTPLHATLLDYLGPNTPVILDGLATLEDRYATLVSMGSSHPFFSSIEEFLNKIESHPRLLLSETPIGELTEIQQHSLKGSSFYSEKEVFHSISFSMFNRNFSAKLWKSTFQPLTDCLFPESEEEKSGKELLGRLKNLPEEWTVAFLSESEAETARFKQSIEEAALPLKAHSKEETGYLSSGFVICDSHYLVFPSTELNRRYKIRRQKLRSTYHTSPIEIYELVPGEMVVHIHNGIGRYLGMESKPNHLGISSEFLVIEYAENAKLYVPLNQVHLVSKYVGSSEESPKLHTIGSGKWKKIKEQTERAVVGYAAELLKNYAEREIKKGVVYPKDSDDTFLFEDEFPFVETEDQLAAVLAIKEDMYSDKALDRLICGDVGYGKTEVAMRAAFKAVADGKKQVAVLVPTTVLAMQHYENFVERMRNFPINIGVVSRFKTAKQIKETLEKVEKGAIDILVGTHRLISGDVRFKDLGLIIIDEEQRFGVKAKEHLKKIKVGVDCLTLSATPIPRTLYMSMIGVRDMSVINTPPQDRIPIKTIISQADDATIRNALMRELARDGQIFFIHNRVETIYDAASRLKKLLPQARIIVAHGQMNTEEIDAAFHTFKSGQADILVATTIVENGIDIPNANTILIDRADRFGLAALYQLRGRVGRWNRRAYAYFLIPHFDKLPEISKKRLQALAESSGYGAGMKIALHDLEIRGAGDILGTEQSGHISAVGFYLYCKLLKRAIKALRGEKRVETETKVEFLIDARLPQTYVEEVSLRMEFYQRFGDAATLQEIEELFKEMEDRFGKAPVEADYLYRLAKIRLFAGEKGITLIKQDRFSLTIERQKGGKTESRKVLCSAFKTPKELEKKILEFIKTL